MKIFLYQDSKSFVHRLDPRTKLVCLVIFFLLSLLSHNLAYMACLTVFSLVLVFLSRSTSQVKALAVPLLLLALFSFIFWSITGRFSKAGMVYGLAMALRLNAIMICGLIFLSTTRLEDFTNG